MDHKEDDFKNNANDLLTPATAILREYFTHDSFTDLQKECILALMAGKDVTAFLPTGAGKSLCFQVPALYLYQL